MMTKPKRSISAWEVTQVTLAWEDIQVAIQVAIQVVTLEVDTLEVDTLEVVTLEVDTLEVDTLVDTLEVVTLEVVTLEVDTMEVDTLVDTLEQVVTGHPTTPVTLWEDMTVSLTGAVKAVKAVQGHREVCRGHLHLRGTLRPLKNRLTTLKQ